MINLIGAKGTSCSTRAAPSGALVGGTALGSCGRSDWGGGGGGGGPFASGCVIGVGKYWACATRGGGGGRLFGGAIVFLSANLDDGVHVGGTSMS